MFEGRGTGWGRWGGGGGGGGGGGSAEVRGEVEKGRWRWIGNFNRGAARARYLGFIVAAALGRLIRKPSQLMQYTRAITALIYDTLRHFILKLRTSLNN